MFQGLLSLIAIGFFGWLGLLGLREFARIARGPIDLAPPVPPTMLRAGSPARVIVRSLVAFGEEVLLEVVPRKRRLDATIPSTWFLTSADRRAAVSRWCDDEAVLDLVGAELGLTLGDGQRSVAIVELDSMPDPIGPADQ